MRFPRRGRYEGRLAFDPDAGFHTDAKGRRVVTVDEGLSWRYARRSDTSHNARYQQRVLLVESTANQATPEPHHFEVQPGDAHYDGLVADPDVVAATVTSHTEAYRG